MATNFLERGGGHSERGVGEGVNDDMVVEISIILNRSLDKSMLKRHLE